MVALVCVALVVALIALAVGVHAMGMAREAAIKAASVKKRADESYLKTNKRLSDHLRSKLH